jgi:hypothetical protein
MTIDPRTLSSQPSPGEVTLDDIADIDNLKKAWNWLRTDMEDDYIKDPTFYLDYRYSLEKNLRDLSARIREHRYRPRRTTIVEVTKPSFTTRPMSFPVLEDRLVAWAILAKIGPILDSKIPDISMAFRVKQPPTRRNFFKSWYREWPSFIRHVREATGDAFPCVLVTDMAGFFENIDLFRLKEMILNVHGISDDVVELLFQQLELWVWHFLYSSARGRGLLQGSDVSSLYANFFLWQIDDYFSRQSNLAYYRFMDDIDMLAPSEAAAKKALQRLCIALRNKTLTINTAKTHILRGPAIEEYFRFNLWDRLDSLLDNIRKSGRTPRIQNHAKRAYKIILEQVGVGSSHFRRFLTALKRMRDPMLWQDCLDYLVTHPAQTDKMMEYALSLENAMMVFRDLTAFLRDSQRNLYPSQEQEILETLLRLDLVGMQVIRPFLGFCINKVHDRGTDNYSASLYTLFIYKYGRPEELRKLNRLFHSGYITHPILRKHLALSCTRLSRDKVTEVQNTLLADADPDLTRLGIFMREVTAMNSTKELRRMVRPTLLGFGKTKLLDLDIRQIIAINLLKLNRHSQNNTELRAQLGTLRSKISYRRTKYLISEIIQDIERHL